MQLKMRVRKCLLLDFGWFHANSIRPCTLPDTLRTKWDVICFTGGELTLLRKRGSSLPPIGISVIVQSPGQADFFHHRLWCDAVMIDFPPPSVSTYSESLLSRSGRSFLTSRDPERDLLLRKFGFQICAAFSCQIFTCFLSENFHFLGNIGHLRSPLLLLLLCRLCPRLLLLLRLL